MLPPRLAAQAEKREAVLPNAHDCGALIMSFEKDETKSRDERREESAVRD